MRLRRRLGEEVVVSIRGHYHTGRISNVGRLGCTVALDEPVDTAFVFRLDAEIFDVAVLANE